MTDISDDQSDGSPPGSNEGAADSGAVTETSQVDTSTSDGAGSSKQDSSEIPQAETRRALIRLIAFLVVGLSLAFLTGQLKTVLVVMAIAAMIMIHELGHFATAKWSGMKVTEYFLGFGPRLWSIRRGETEYGVKALPLGGYVKIIGMSNLEEVAPEDESRTYRQKSFLRKLSVACAGSFMHFVMAFLLLVAINGWVGIPTASNRVGSVTELRQGQSPAQIAGFQKGDKVLAVDDHPIKKWTEIPPYIQTRIGVPIKFTVERNGQRMDLTATPVDRQKLDLSPAAQVAPTTGAAVGFVGIGAAVEAQTAPLVTAVGRSGSQFWQAGSEVVKTIVHRYSPNGIKEYVSLLVDSTRAASTSDPGDAPTAGDGSSAEDARFVSPVGLVGYASYAADSGMRGVLIFLFSINIFVGIFNLIPLLPFDGGHVSVAVYERIRSFRGRRHTVDFAKLLPVSYAVLMVLLLTTLSSLWLDIFNPLPNPFQ